MENAEMDEADAMRAILLEFLAEDIFTSQAEPPTEPAVQPHVSGQEQQHGGGGAAASDQLSLVEAEEEEQPNGRPAAPAAARRQRKRGLTSQQKVSLLQKRIAEQTAMLQRLSLDNVWATQRVRMLELVIKVRDEQATRLASAKEGTLTTNPFAVLDTTLEEVLKAAPPLIMSRIVKDSNDMAKRLTPLLLVLEQHPSLLVGPVPGVTWAALREGSVPLPPGVGQGDAQGWATLGPLPVEPSVMQDLYKVVDLMNQTITAGIYILGLCPHFLVSSSIHVLAVDPTQHASWDALASLVTRSHGSATATAGQEQGSGTPPPVAPPGHWKTAMGRLKLSDEQKQQAAALRSIIAGPLAAIRRQRAEIGAAFAQLRGGAHGGDGGAAANSATTATSTTASHGDALVLARHNATTAIDAYPLQQSAETLHQEEKLLDGLQHTLVREAGLILLVHEVLAQHLMTPVQAALLLINTWPYVPDNLAIMDAAAEGFGPPVP